jgi:hypothetical protein
MFETVLKILDLLLKALPIVPASKKKKLAKDLLAVYQGLESLIASGVEILKAVQRYNAIQESNWEAHDECTGYLRKLLMEQEDRVRRLQSILARKHIANVLSIRLPKLHPLLLHGLEGKHESLKLSLATLETLRALERDPGIKELIGEGRISKSQYPSEANFDLLSEAFDKIELRKAKLQLQKISSLVQELRRFLAANFTIEELA